MSPVDSAGPVHIGMNFALALDYEGVVPHFSSGIVKSERNASARGNHRLFSRGVTFTRARVSFAIPEEK